MSFCWFYRAVANLIVWSRKISEKCRLRTGGFQIRGFMRDHLKLFSLWRVPITQGAKSTLVSFDFSRMYDIETFVFAWLIRCHWTLVSWHRLRPIVGLHNRDDYLFRIILITIHTPGLWHSVVENVVRFDRAILSLMPQNLIVCGQSTGT